MNRNSDNENFNRRCPMAKILWKVQTQTSSSRENEIILLGIQRKRINELGCHTANECSYDKRRRIQYKFMNSKMFARPNGFIVAPTESQRLAHHFLYSSTHTPKKAQTELPLLFHTKRFRYGSAVPFTPLHSVFSRLFNEIIAITAHIISIELFQVRKTVN